MTPSNIYQSVTGADGGVEASEVSNGLTHVSALSLTKIADGLIDPKLILSWVLNALGTPATFIGALVPMREAGALLPQLAIARLVGASGKRKPFWAIGSFLQGMAAIGIGGPPCSSMDWLRDGRFSVASWFCRWPVPSVR